MSGTETIVDLAERGTYGFSHGTVPVTWSYRLWNDHACVSVIRVPSPRRGRRYDGLVFGDPPANPTKRLHCSLVGDEGVDVADFRYGVRCRVGIDPAPLDDLVRDVMDYRNFDAANAPTSCP